MSNYSKVVVLRPISAPLAQINIQMGMNFFRAIISHGTGPSESHNELNKFGTDTI